MPSCKPTCGLCSANGEDGVLSGNKVPIHPDFSKPLSVLFQSLLKTKKIVGSKTATEFHGSEMTFDQLEDFSNALANDMRDRIGMDPKIMCPNGDPLIAIIVPGSEKSMALILAILKLGATCLPLDYTYPETLLLKIIKAFKPILIVVAENGPIFNKYEPATFAEASEGKLVTLDELWIDLEIPRATATPAQRRSSITPQLLDFLPKRPGPPELQPAFVLHGRGFHEHPVGIRISHLAIINRCLFEWNFLGLKEDQECSMTKCISQMGAINQIFCVLLRGCTLHIFLKTELKDTTEFIKDISSKQITILDIPYYHLFEVLKSIDAAGREESLRCLKALRCIICRGGYIPHHEAVKFFDVFKKNVVLMNSSGSLETTGALMYEEFTSMKDYENKTVMGRLTLGKVLQNTSIYLFSPTLQLVSDGHQGEFYASGMSVALGYVDAKESGDNEFVKNPHTAEKEIVFKSGEYGQIVRTKGGKRALYDEGRETDRLVRQKGHEFFVSDVVPFLAELDFVKEVNLYVLQKGKPNQELIAVILVKPEIKTNNFPDRYEIEEKLRENLPEWAVPDEFFLIRFYPTHYYGGCCPFCIVQDFRDQREPEFDTWKDRLVIAPERRDAAILLIRAIYKVTYIPIDTIMANLRGSFYELGGSSLTTVSVIVYLNKNGYPMSLHDFYTTPNLMEFIAMMVNKCPIAPVKSTMSTDISSSISKETTAEAFPADNDNAALVQPDFCVMPEVNTQYDTVLLKKKNKKDVVRLLTTAYCDKNEVAHYNMVPYVDFEMFMTEVVNSVSNEELSITVTRKRDKKLVAAVICQDFFKVIETIQGSGVVYNIEEFMHEVKGNILPFLPHRFGETLEISWMGTHFSLHPDENVKMVTLLHSEVIKLALHRGYSGIFHSTLNLLSRTLCTDVFGYEVFEDFRINKYCDDDGYRPFHLAGDTAACAAMYLKLRDPSPPSQEISTNVVDPVQFYSTIGHRRFSQIKYYHDGNSVPDPTTHGPKPTASSATSKK